MSSPIHLGHVASTALLLAVLAIPARAANRTWVGMNNDWNSNTGNWNPADEPDSDDTAIFNTSHSVDLVNSSESINGLTMSGGIDLNLNGNDMTVDGLVQLSGASTFLFVPSGSVLTPDAVTINSGATLRMTGGTMTINEESGDGPLDINSGGIVNGNGIISFTDAVSAGTTLLVNNGTINATFAFPVDVDGSGAGTLTIQASDGDARVDLDGDGVASGVVSVARNDTLDVNVPLLDEFNGTINLAAGATLDIEDAWSNSGIINVDTVGLSPGTAGPAATISGGNLTLNSASIAMFDVTDSLRVAGPFNAVTGTIANAGKIIFDDTATIGTAFSFLMGSASQLEINAEVTVNVTDWNWDADGGMDNVITIGPAGRLNVDLANGIENDIWDGVMQINGGILNVDGTGDSWHNERMIELAGGELRGTATLVNDSSSSLKGHGLISVPVDNDALIRAENGTLVVETAANDNDWDGANNDGQLQAFSGDLELRDDAQFLFDGTVSAFSGHEVFVNGFRLNFDAGSELGLFGGRYRATHLIHLGGELFVGAGASTVQTGDRMIFTQNSTTDLTGDLTLDNDLTIVEVGAEFLGGGALVNAPGRTLLLWDGITAAELAVTIVNNGALSIDQPFTIGTPGQAQGVDYEQTASGRWGLDVGGVGLTAFDRFTLTGAAVLDGTLELSLEIGFVPELGNTFNILSAAGGVNGTFAALMQPAAMPAGLLFDINYLGTIVQLEVVSVPTFTADFDHDGDVDGDDLDDWQAAYSLNALADADSDGDSDGRDFLEWQRQFGSGLGPLAASLTVPEPSSLAIAVVSVVFLLRRQDPLRGRL
jgi:hypothetical protein